MTEREGRLEGNIQGPKLFGEMGEFLKGVGCPQWHQGGDPRGPLPQTVAKL